MPTRLLLEATKKGIHLFLKNGELAFKAPPGALTADLKKAISENKSAIIELLKSHQKSLPGMAQIGKMDRANKPLLLSYAQQRLWLLDRIDGGSAHYNMPFALKLEGALNQDVLNQAFTTIIARHESLRTCFTEGGDGQPLQVIQAAAPFAIALTDLSVWTDGERQIKLAEQIEQEAGRKFDLSRDLMLRARLLKMATDGHVLLVTMHHIASDGWSMTILINEFSTLYQAFALGQPDPLPPLTIQYADYGHWQRNWLQGEVLEQQLGYWATRLANLPVVHSLPLDHARPAIQSFVGDLYSSQIDAATSGALNALCQASGATLFMGLHAAFSVLLARYSNETDIVVGSPIANREQAEVAGLIGFFVNTLILRSDLSGNPDFTTLLGRSRAMLLDAWAHQQVPFEQIVERLQPPRSLSHGALFQVMLVLQNNEVGRLELPGLTLSPVEQPGGVAKYDLALNISESAQGLSLGWEYNIDLFEAATIARMAQHFSILLKALVNKPEVSVLSADMIDDAERRQLLAGWCDTATTYPGDKCIHELFEEQAVQNPDAVAVVFGGRQLSYAELNAKANQLAHYLVAEKQVKPDTLVGICVERSLEMVIGIMGILKAGGAYVPLDPDYPKARLQYMLEDAKLTTVLTQSHLLARTPVSAAQALCLDDADVQKQLALLPTHTVSAQARGLHSQHLAYVIYTSGSTGNPKGVMVEHHNVTRLMRVSLKHFDFGGDDVWTLFHSYAFDFSVWEIWGALSMGARLVVVPYWITRSPGEFYKLLEQEKVTVLNQTPSAFSNLMPEDEAAQANLVLRYVVFGGEALNFASLVSWVKRRGDDSPQLINMYGITETTVHVTFRRMTRESVLDSKGASLIGVPLADLQVVILSKEKTLVPVGVAGEMYVAGSGVTRGYLNQPQITAERFVALAEFGGQRFYRSGDLARRLPDGELDYLGRIDHQVKIRGFRIELGEIESALASHGQVSDAVVLVKDAAAGDKRLVAYVVSNDADFNAQLRGDDALTARQTLIENLRQHLGRSLPDYMVPAAWVLLASLPLTPNGKVDRKALPEPDASQQQAAWVAPRSALEQQMCDLWQEVLGLERVGISDNFFLLGGHSLSATRLIARINQTFKVALPLRAVFQSQTLEALAHAVAQLDAGSGLPPLLSVPRDATLLPSYAQQRLWLLDRIDGGSAHYNMPVALRLTGALNQDALNLAFTTIIARHESLRTCFAESGDGQPLQVIQAAVPFVISLTDLSDLSAYADGERQLKLVALLAEEAGRIFDLSRDLMLRAHLVRMAADEHILLVTMHHIASDGWSMTILINEFSALYQAYALGQPDPLPPLTIQYADYAHWQRNWLQGEVLEQQLGYWTTQLANLPVVHSLPLDHARPTMQSFVGDIWASQIDAATSGALNALCQACGATLFMGLHAAFSVLLARYSNETDIVVGSPIANREQAEVAGLIGFFVNTLVLRSDLSGNPDFITLLGTSRAMLLDAWAHQQVPFEQLVERLQPARSLSHSPLFQVMLALQNIEGGMLELPGLTLSPVESAASVAKYDLTLNISESAQGLSLCWEYNTDLFEAATIARMAQHFDVLLQALVSKPQVSVLSADMLGAAERRQLLVEWNDTARDYPHDQCIHQLFEAQVAQNPDAVAVLFEDRQLSYGELNAKANQLAHYLAAEKQVKPDTLVGICVERSLEMVIGILAILKAGGAYVPLDPDYPRARLEYMLTDANLTTVLTQSHLLERTPVSAAQALCLDDASLQQLLAQQPVVNIVPHSLGLHAQHLAYVIYTSGSTGNPKGSLLNHSGLSNLAMAQGIGLAITPASRVLQFASIAFDAATWELSMALAHGAAIVLPGNAAAKSPDALSAVVEQCRVTHATLPPVLLPLLTIEKWASVHTLVVAGDTCSGQMARLWSANRTFINAYGPSEATVCTTMGRYQPDQACLHIGKPLQNMTVYVLTQLHEPVPMGVAGELYIGGVGLSRGYLNRPDLTEEKFIANPFHNASDPAGSKRLYKTGDLVRWLPDGNMEYLGRIDQQVKIRGFRIEPGEIENALNSHAQVSDAVVLVKGGTPGDKRLVAYVVTNDASLAAQNENEDGSDNQDDNETALAARHALIEGLRQHLGRNLPDYMMPAAYVLLASLPLTPNGKVDRKALPEPDTSQQQAWVAPRSGVEQRLCALWQEVLGLERVGISDNFFHLGGHSLSATRLVARINQVFKVVLPLRAVFQSSTLEVLARTVAQEVEQQGAGTWRPALQSVPRDVALPASYAQQRLWLLDRIDGGSVHYNMPMALRLEGALNLDALNSAFTTLFARHESLRTCFLENGAGAPLQVIQAATPFAIALADLSVCADGERQIKLAELLAEEAGRIFDLSRDLMLRARLLKMATDDHVLLVTMHHIASDGWSMTILINEFSTLYQAFALGQSDPLPPLTIQYADYAHWQRNWLQGEVLEQQLGYWTTRLANLPLVHSLPLDHARPAMQSFVGETWVSQIDAATSGAFNALCQASGATLFMGLHAAFSVLLARYSNETDIVVGSPIANREQAEVAGLIGFFVNTLVLRSDLSGNPDFTELLGRSRAMLLDAWAHQQVPFEQIVERLQPPRSLSHGALFQVMLVLQNNEVGRLELPGLTLSPVESASSVTKYDLTLTVSEGAQGLALFWQYNTDLFEATTIARMAQHFGILLKAFASNSQASVFGIDMLSAAERHRLLIELNDTATDYPRDTCIHQLFEAQAAQKPDAVAVVYEGRQLSYAELNASANQLAHYLVTEKQVKPDTLVGICIGRSLEMVIGILGILKAGGAYVPLDPDYPSARLEYMLGDANLATVLTQKHLLMRTPQSAAQALCLDDANVQQLLALQPLANIAPQSLGLHAQHLAYVIYTSGSTGNPKGVLQTHQTVANLVQATAFADGINRPLRTLQYASGSFDVSIQEIATAWHTGGTLLLSAVEKRDLMALPELLQSLCVERVFLPPAVLHWLAERMQQQQQQQPPQQQQLLPHLREVFAAGEALFMNDTLAHFLELHPDCQLWNHYGPTETHVATRHRVYGIGGAVPIGTPVSNLNALVLSAWGQLAPVGVAGELLIGGAGLARGYLNRPELTSEKFIANPFHDATDPSGSERLYKTGDLVRWLPDGSLEYMGRIDHQVKIRGFRIELGEIENALTSHAEVSDAVVLAKDGPGGDQRLVAYVVMAVTVVTNDDDASLATQDENGNGSETVRAAHHALIEGLRKHLSSSLPDYMVPAAYVLLASLPLTPNGKVDRKALPEPDASQQQVAFVAPRSETEQRLCALWQEVLGLERVGISDNFFQLGGHSLSATRLVARINQAFKVVLPLRAVFQSPTLEALAQGVAYAVAQQGAGPWLPPLQSVPRDLALQPSYAQQRLWLLDQIDGGSAHYNMPSALKLDGELNQEALTRAFTSIIARHESLRTCFVEGGDGQPLQIIQAAAPFVVALTDLSAFADGERQRKLAELLAQEASLAFDLSRDLMLRARLLKMASDEHVLLVTMHHITSDGWSMAILINEFSALYQAFVLAQPDPLPPLTIQYADYAHWQRNWLQGEVLEQQLGYWTTRLAGLPAVHSLPLDHARPAIQSFVGETWVSQIDAATSGALNALCQASGATLFMGLHAAFSVLLARYSNETDIVVGSPIANREQAEVAGLIGFFVNTLVLRSDLSDNPDFTTLLGRSRAMLLDAWAHQQVPFEQIVERLQPARSLSHSPLFQVTLVLQNNEGGTLELPGLTLSPVESAGRVAKYDLTLSISESAQGLLLGWEYNTALFEEATIDRMARHFDALLQALTSTPQASVLGADMLGQAGRRQLLVEWNNTTTDYPRDKCIHELFEAQAAQNPDAVAVLFEGKQLSYGELNAKANQLAHYLVAEKQVKPDTLVGICVERSLELVIGIMAILKAGGAYVPLDPDYPKARLEYMLADANLSTVLTQSHLLERTPVSAAQALCLDDASVQQLLALQPVANIVPQSLGLHAQHLAYLIYTSGSTGNPKGSLLKHSGLSNLAMAQGIGFAITPASRVLQFASIAFDAATWELNMALPLGASIVLLSNAAAKSPDALSAVVEQYRVTHATLPPVLLPLLDIEKWTSVRTLVVAGDTCSVQMARLWSADRVFINAYGPSETTVCATMGRYQPDQACLHIGKPLQNMTVYVLTQAQELVPPGVAGELYIGGVGLSRGYLNRPDLTDEKFIANPFYDANDPASSERLYRTGDLVRWLPDGNMEYLGRIDLQVKVRGFRIEPGEIENALNSHAQVSDAVVLAKDGVPGDKRLVAYVVPVVSKEDASLAAQDEGGNESDNDSDSDSETVRVARLALIEALRQHLGSSLPDYMVPAAFVLLDSLPLTPNGKVDRKALPEPDAAQQQVVYVAPRNELEQRLCAVWQDVLELERVGITDNFFQLGGHSLLAVQLMSRIRQASGVEIPLRTLFVAPTVEMLAASISAESAGAAGAGFSNLVPIRPTGNLPPLFLIHPGEGEIGYARAITPWLDADLPVYALAAIGFLDGEVTLQSIAEMASTYLRAIRHVQPHGPYRVAGWSAGGTIAYEIARQLLDAGEVVEYLGLIDTTSDYSGLKHQLALPPGANMEAVDLDANLDANLDDAAILLTSLAQDVPQSLLQELQALAASGAVTAMLEQCRSAGIFPADIDTTTLRRHLAVRASIQRALFDYTPLPIPVRVTLFTATEGARADLAQGWVALAQAGMEVLRVEGNHYSIMEAPNIQALGKALSESILLVA